MLRLISCLCWVIFLPVMSSAQAWFTHDVCSVSVPKYDLGVFQDIDTSNIDAAVANVPNGTGRYWQVRHTSGAVSHLWGTTHSNNPAHLKFDDIVEQQIKIARVVAVELDPLFSSRVEFTEQMTNPDIVVETYSNNVLPVNRLNETIDPRIVSWIDSRLESLGWGPDASQFVKPDALAEQLLNGPCNDFNAGVYPIQDSLIQMLGAAHGAKVVGLEDVDAFRTAMADRGHRARLFNTISLYGFALRPGLSVPMAQTYLALELEGRTAIAMELERLHANAFFGGDKGDTMIRSVDRYLLDERNINFADVIEAELQIGDVFIAIGSWHLPGTAGMVELLRARGYTVTRIKLPREAR